MTGARANRLGAKQDAIIRLATGRSITTLDVVAAGLAKYHQAQQMIRSLKLKGWLRWVGDRASRNHPAHWERTEKRLPTEVPNGE